MLPSWRFCAAGVVKVGDAALATDRLWRMRPVHLSDRLGRAMNHRKWANGNVIATAKLRWPGGSAADRRQAAESPYPSVAGCEITASELPPMTLGKRP